MSKGEKAYYDPSKPCKKAVDYHGKMTLYEVVFLAAKTKTMGVFTRAKQRQPKYAINARLVIHGMIIGGKKNVDFDVERIWYDKESKEYYYESREGALLDEWLLRERLDEGEEIRV